MRLRSYIADYRNRQLTIRRLQASRGPIGAVQLLWSLKRRSFSAVLPVAGALLALFALFIDPFTQQIVQFYSCSRVQPELRATIPRTNNFTSPLWSQGSMSYGIGGTGNLTKDMGLQGAIYAGLFDASPVSAAYVPASCPSGNCTFDPYWSLGMCSACQDATPKLDIECKPYSWWNASSLMATGEEWNIGAPLCNFTWADSVSLEPGLLNATWPQFNMTFQRLVAPTAGTTIVGRGKKAPTEPIIDTGEFESQIIWGRFIRWLSPTASPDFSQYIKPLNLDPLAQGIGATECVLYPCIQEYNSHIEGGTFSEQIVSSAPVSVVSEYFLGNKEPAGSVTVRTACLNKNDRDVLTRLGYDLDAETQWLAVNGPDFLNLGEKIDQSCIFSMLGDFSSVLPTITQNLLVPDAANSQGWQGVFGGQPDYYQTGSVLESFYDYGYVTQNSLSARFEGMAAALTSFMRRHSGDVPSSSRVPASGTVWVSDTCVAVEWDWITLPSALLLLASCYFMIAVRSMSRSRYQNAWKSSSVAPLYLGLDSDVRSDMGSLEDLKEMEAIAQRLNVQLKAVGQGWRFAKAGPSEMTDVEQ